MTESEWPTLLLAVIAVSTVVIAIVQIGLVVYCARLARRVNRLADRVEREIDPVLETVQEIADTAKAARLVLAQFERADQGVVQIARRAEELLDVAQRVLITPARRVLALIEGLKATIAPDPAPTDAKPRDEASSEAAKTGSSDDRPTLRGVR